MDERPVIGIVGGIRQETLKEITKDEFDKNIEGYRKACQALGDSLAKAQMRLLVWSSDPQFIEIEVVKGYLATENVLKHSVLCVWNRDYAPSFPHQHAENNAIQLKQSHHNDWEIGFYESIKQEADGVVLLGGGTTTLVAGLVAASWGKALFTTPHFHGKAAMLYRWMHTNSSVVASSPVAGEDIDSMSQPWDPQACVESLRRQFSVIESRKAQHENKQQHYSSIERRFERMQSAQRRAVAVAVAILAFVASMVAAIAIPTGIADFVSFFLVLISGGALGSSLNLLGTQRDSVLPISGTLAIGAGIGIIVGVVQVSPNIPQVFRNECPSRLTAHWSFPVRSLPC